MSKDSKVTFLTQWHKPHRKILLKLIALSVTLSFLFPYLTWAFEGTSYPAAGTAVIYNHKLVKIPEKLGAVTGAFQGKDQLVIHIQDLHCNFEVQSNIAQLIAALSAEQKLKLVAVEGASQSVNVAQLKNIAKARVRQAVGQYLMKQGKLSGAEWSAAASHADLLLEGIEKAELYTASRKAVGEFLNDESQGYVYDLREMFKEIRAGIYGPALLALDNQKQANREGETPLLKYAAYLCSAAQKQGVSLKAFPNLAMFVQKDTTQAGINAEVLNDELEALDKTVRETLYANGAERELDQAMHRLDLVERLLNISVRPAELQEYRHDPGSFRTSRFLEFIKQHGDGADLNADVDVLALDKYLDRAGKFYALADERSEVFVTNTLARMSEYQTGLAVLVTGGFHTQGVLQNLKNRNISYISVRPKITHEDLVNPYYALLRNRHTPLEKLLAENQNILAIESEYPQTAPALRNQALSPAQMAAQPAHVQLNAKLVSLIDLMAEGAVGAKDAAFAAELQKAAAGNSAVYRIVSSKSNDAANTHVVYLAQGSAEKASLAVVIRPENSGPALGRSLANVTLEDTKFEAQLAESASIEGAEAGILRARQPFFGSLSAWLGSKFKLAPAASVAFAGPGMPLGIFLSPALLQAVQTLPAQLGRVVSSFSLPTVEENGHPANWAQQILMALNQMTVTHLIFFIAGLGVMVVGIGALTVGGAVPAVVTLLFGGLLNYALLWKNLQQIAAGNLRPVLAGVPAFGRVRGAAEKLLGTSLTKAEADFNQFTTGNSSARQEVQAQGVFNLPQLKPVSLFGLGQALPASEELASQLPKSFSSEARAQAANGLAAIMLRLRGELGYFTGADVARVFDEALNSGKTVEAAVQEFVSLRDGLDQNGVLGVRDKVVENYLGKRATGKLGRDIINYFIDKNLRANYFFNISSKTDQALKDWAAATFGSEAFKVWKKAQFLEDQAIHPDLAAAFVQWAHDQHKTLPDILNAQDAFFKSSSGVAGQRDAFSLKATDSPLQQFFTYFQGQSAAAKKLSLGDMATQLRKFVLPYLEAESLTSAESLQQLNRNLAHFAQFLENDSPNTFRQEPGGMGYVYARLQQRKFELENAPGNRAGVAVFGLETESRSKEIAWFSRNVEDAVQGQRTVFTSEDIKYARQLWNSGGDWEQKFMQNVQQAAAKIRTPENIRAVRAELLARLQQLRLMGKKADWFDLGWAYAAVLDKVAKEQAGKFGITPAQMKVSLSKTGDPEITAWMALYAEVVDQVLPQKDRAQGEMTAATWQQAQQKLEAQVRGAAEKITLAGENSFNTDQAEHTTIFLEIKARLEGFVGRIGGVDQFINMLNKRNVRYDSRNEKLIRNALHQLQAAGFDFGKNKWDQRIHLLNIPQSRLQRVRGANTERMGGVIVEGADGVLHTVLPLKSLENLTPETLAELLHEIVEMGQMENGVPDKEAHQNALRVEAAFLREAGSAKPQTAALVKSILQSSTNYSPSSSELLDGYLSTIFESGAMLLLLWGLSPVFALIYGLLVMDIFELLLTLVLFHYYPNVAIAFVVLDLVISLLVLPIKLASMKRRYAAARFGILSKKVLAGVDPRPYLGNGRELAVTLLQHGQIPEFIYSKKSLEAMRELKKKNPDVLLAAEIHHMEAIRSARAGADILVSSMLLSSENIKELRAAQPGVFIIASVYNRQEAVTAIQNGADGIKITNFSETEARRIENLKLVEELRSQYPHILFGGAGGINAANAAKILQGGLDFISSGTDNSDADVQALQKNIVPILAGTEKEQPGNGTHPFLIQARTGLAAKPPTGSGIIIVKGAAEKRTQTQAPASAKEQLGVVMGTPGTHAFAAQTGFAAKRLAWLAAVLQGAGMTLLGVSVPWLVIPAIVIGLLFGGILTVGAVQYGSMAGAVQLAMNGDLASRNPDASFEQLEKLRAQALADPIALSNGWVEPGAMEILTEINPRMAALVKLHEQFRSDFMGMLAVLPVVRNLVSLFISLPAAVDYGQIHVAIEQPEVITGAQQQFVGKKQTFTLTNRGNNKAKLKGVRYEIEGKTYIQYGDRWLFFNRPVAEDAIPLKYLLDGELQVGNPALREFLGVEKLAASTAAVSLPAGVEAVTELKGFFENEYSDKNRQDAIKLLQSTNLLKLADSGTFNENDLVAYMDALMVVSHKGVSAYEEFVNGVSSLDIFQGLLPQMNVRVRAQLRKKIQETMDFCIKRKMTYPKQLLDFVAERPYIQSFIKTAPDQYQTNIDQNGHISQIDTANAVNWPSESGAHEKKDLLREADAKAGGEAHRAEYLKKFQVVPEIGIAGEGSRLLKEHFRLNKMFGRFIQVKPGSEKLLEKYFADKGYKQFKLWYQGGKAYLGITHLVLTLNPEALILAGMSTVEPSEEWIGEVKGFLILTQDITNPLDTFGRFLKELLIAGHGRLVTLVMEEKKQLSKMLTLGRVWRHVQGDDLGNEVNGSLMARQIMLGRTPMVILTTPQVITPASLDNLAKTQKALSEGKAVTYNGKPVVDIIVDEKNEENSVFTLEGGEVVRVADLSQPLKQALAHVEELKARASAQTGQAQRETWIEAMKYYDKEVAGYAKKTAFKIGKDSQAVFTLVANKGGHLLKSDRDNFCVEQSRYGSSVTMLSKSEPVQAKNILKDLVDQAAKTPDLTLNGVRVIKVTGDTVFLDGGTEVSLKPVFEEHASRVARLEEMRQAVAGLEGQALEEKWQEVLAFYREQVHEFQQHYVFRWEEKKKNGDIEDKELQLLDNTAPHFSQSTFLAIVPKYFNTNNFALDPVAVVANRDPEVKALYHKFLREAAEHAGDEDWVLAARKRLEADTNRILSRISDAEWQARCLVVERLNNSLYPFPVERKKGKDGIYIKINTMAQDVASFEAKMALSNLTAESVDLKDIDRVLEQAAKGENFSQRAAAKSGSLRCQDGSLLELKPTPGLTALNLQEVDVLQVPTLDFTQFKKSEDMPKVIGTANDLMQQELGQEVFVPRTLTQTQGKDLVEWAEKVAPLSLIGPGTLRMLREIGAQVEEYGDNLPKEYSAGARENYARLTNMVQILNTLVYSQNYAALKTWSRRCERSGIYLTSVRMQQLLDMTLAATQPGITGWLNRWIYPLVMASFQVINRLVLAARSSQDKKAVAEAYGLVKQKGGCTVLDLVLEHGIPELQARAILEYLASYPAEGTAYAGIDKKSTPEDRRVIYYPLELKAPDMNKVSVVIMASGDDSAFWPLANGRTQRAFRSLVPGGDPLVVEQIKLAVKIGINFHNIFIPCKAEAREALLAILPPGFPPQNVLQEPQGNQSAAAMGLALEQIKRRYEEDRTVIMLPAKNLIAGNEAQLKETFKAAVQGAQNSQAIVSIGAPVKAAVPFFGYLRLGPKSKVGASNHDLKQIVEKPQPALASKLAADPQVLHNTGITVMRVSTGIAAFTESSPIIARWMEEVADNLGGENEEEYLKRPLADKVLVNLADFTTKILLGSQNRLTVVPTTFNWQPNPNWNMLSALKPDSGQNQIAGAGRQIIVAPDRVRGSIIYAGQGKKIFISQAENLIIVAEENVLLVMHRDQAGQLPTLLAEMRRHKDYEPFVTGNRNQQPLQVQKIQRHGTNSYKGLAFMNDATSRCDIGQHQGVVMLVGVNGVAVSQDPTSGAWTITQQLQTSAQTVTGGLMPWALGLWTWLGGKAQTYQLGIAWWFENLLSAKVSAAVLSPLVVWGMSLAGKKVALSALSGSMGWVSFVALHFVQMLIGLGYKIAGKEAPVALRAPPIENIIAVAVIVALGLVLGVGPLSLGGVLLHLAGTIATAIIRAWTAPKVSQAQAETKAAENHSAVISLEQVLGPEFQQHKPGEELFPNHPLVNILRKYFLHQDIPYMIKHIRFQVGEKVSAANARYDAMSPGLKTTALNTENTGTVITLTRELAPFLKPQTGRMSLWQSFNFWRLKRILSRDLNPALAAYRQETLSELNQKDAEDGILEKEFGASLVRGRVSDLRQAGGQLQAQFLRAQKQRPVGVSSAQLSLLIESIRTALGTKEKPVESLWQVVDPKRKFLLKDGQLRSSALLVNALMDIYPKDIKDAALRNTVIALQTGLEAAALADKQLPGRLELERKHVVEVIIRSQQEALVTPELLAAMPKLKATEASDQITLLTDTSTFQAMGETVRELLNTKNINPNLKAKLQLIQSVLGHQMPPQEQSVLLQELLAQVSLPEGSLLATEVGEDISKYVGSVVTGRVEVVHLGNMWVAKPVVQNVFSSQEIKGLGDTAAANRPVSFANFTGKWPDPMPREGYFEENMAELLPGAIFQGHLGVRSELAQAYYLWHHNPNAENEQKLFRVLIRMMKYQARQLGTETEPGTLDKKTYGEALRAINMLVQKSVMFREHEVVCRSGQTAVLAPASLSYGGKLALIWLWEQFDKDTTISENIDKTLRRQRLKNLRTESAA